MTAPTPPPHLDDEDLSALLDGEAGPDAAAHVAGCATCAGRRDTLVAARDAVRSAPVAPLPAGILDGLVGAALDAAVTGGTVDGPAPAGVLPLERARTRRLTSPPPAWLLGAVASIAVLAGLAGLLRSGGGDDSSVDAANRALPTAGEAAEESSADAGGDADELAAAVDPELVTADLGDVADAAALTQALDAPTDQAFSAGRPLAGASADRAEGAPQEVTTVPAPAAGGAGGTATAAGSAPPADRAQCLVEAERAGAGRLGPLQATATLRWEGRPAEVLVFALAEPADGFSRQALVLARPGCELLADPRF